MIIVKRALIFASVFLILSGCSTMKLIDNSAETGYNRIQDKKVLVAAKSADFGVRKSYENKLVERLRKRGINAVAAWSEFESLTKESLANKSEDEIVTTFRNSGIEVIMVSALREVIEQSKKAEYNSVDFDTSQKGKYYGISFSDYYDSASDLPVLPSKGQTDTPKAIEDTYNTYILEAVIYDITKESGNRHSGTLTVAAESPGHASDVLNGFTRIVSKEYTSN